MVWAGVGGDVEGLVALAAGLSRALGRLGFLGDTRPLAPHLTLGRSRDPRGASGLGGAIAAAASFDPVAWRADALRLVRSHLGPGGPRHETLALLPLGAPGPAAP